MSVYHVQAKDGFQFFGINGRFSKIQPHIHTLVFTSLTFRVILDDCSIRVD